MMADIKSSNTTLNPILVFIPRVAKLSPQDQSTIRWDNDNFIKCEG
jgi:hypothetical protein